MYSTKKIIISVFFLLGTTSLFSQQLSVLAGVNENKGVTIKWFSKEQFNVDGVNIYRKEKDKSDWVKLNQLPVKKMNKIDDPNATDEMKMYDGLINNEPDNDQKENWELMQITKGVLDSKFAQLYGMLYDDESVQSRKTYEYRIVRLQGNIETEGQVSNPVTMQTYKVPLSPEHFQVSAGNLQANFKWSHDKKKFFAYNIYRSTSEKGEYKLINDFPVVIFTFTDSTGKTTNAEFYYTDTTLTEGQNYYYQLEGINYLGFKSLKSGVFKFTGISLLLPPVAVNLKSAIDGNKVSIFWNIENKPVLNEINIYRCTTINGKYEKVNKKVLPVKDTIFSEVIIDPEPAYYYYIESLGKNGKVAKSQILFVSLPDLIPPVKPVGLKGTAETDRIFVTWEMGTEKKLLGYYLYRSATGRDDDYLLLTPYPLKQSEYVDTVEKKTQNFFYYRVSSVNKAYFTSEKSEAIKVRVKDIVPPSEPYITRGSYENGIVYLGWYSGLDEDILGYDLFRCSYPDTSNKVQLNKQIISPQTISYKDSIVVEGTYTYFLQASDTNKNKSALSLAFLIEAVTLDTAITFINNLKAVTDTSNKSITLTWDKISKSNITGYLVFRNEDGVPVVVSEIIKGTNFTDKTPKPGVNIYKVKAYFENGETSESPDIEALFKE